MLSVDFKDPARQSTCRTRSLCAKKMSVLLLLLFVLFVVVVVVVVVVLADWA